MPPRGGPGSLEVIIERLDNIKEEVRSLQESVKTLNEDYIKRQNTHKIFLWAVSTVSAAITFIVTEVIAKWK